MGSERSSSKAPLHNFTLPDGLRWGNQKFLRCMKVNSNGQNSAIQRKDSRFGSSVTNNSYFDHGSNSVLGNENNGFTRSENGDDYASYYSNYGGDRKKGDVGVVEMKQQVAEDGVLLPPEKRMRVEKGGGEDGDGIAAVREKVILDLQTAADKMKDAILRRGSFGFQGAAEEGSRQWNVRTRRATYGIVSRGGNGGVRVIEGGIGGGARDLNFGVIRNSGEALMVSPLRMVEGETTQRLRRVDTSVKEMAVASPSGEKKVKVKFSMALTRREIEEDFIAMVRHRPPRRPMKRPKYIQKQLDTLFPGVSLSEITADKYKVPETT